MLALIFFHNESYHPPMCVLIETHGQRGEKELNSEKIRNNRGPEVPIWNFHHVATATEWQIIY